MLALMSAPDPLMRSPELMSARDTALLVIDVQEKVIGLVPDRKRIVWNVRRLVDGAKLLGLPAVGTEQYPQGLGKTVPELAERLGPLPDKIAFSCRGCAGLFSDLDQRGVFKILVVGIETHVCVQQTVLDLLAAGVRVYVAVDAVGARYPIDHEIALRRMESSGATLTTTEAALFEWCETAGAPGFKEMSKLIREAPP
jgi:nicotinamidase-related amidase